MATQQNPYFSQHNAVRMGKLLLLLGIVAVAFVGMLFLNQLKAFNQGTDLADATTIDVSGTGTAFAIPNIATESYTVQNDAATVADAQAAVTTKANAALAFLKSSGVADADIQTTDYSANPDYTYPAPCTARDCTNVSSSPTITGYTVSETVTVKIRDTSKVGAIVAGLGAAGVTGLSGPNFTVDNPDTVTAQARAQAIDNAKANAQVLASQLGVSLVRITHFSDDSSGAVAPMAYATGMAMEAPTAPAPQISAGQNKYTSNVTLTYEIQ